MLIKRLASSKWFIYVIVHFSFVAEAIIVYVYSWWKSSINEFSELASLHVCPSTQVDLLSWFWRCFVICNPPLPGVKSNFWSPLYLFNFPFNISLVGCLFEIVVLLLLALKANIMYLCTSSLGEREIISFFYISFVLLLVEYGIWILLFFKQHFLFSINLLLFTWCEIMFSLNIRDKINLRIRWKKQTVINYGMLILFVKMASERGDFSNAKVRPPVKNCKIVIHRFSL